MVTMKSGANTMQKTCQYCGSQMELAPPLGKPTYTKDNNGPLKEIDMLICTRCGHKEIFEVSKKP